ncbi:MAG: DASS family sodium-coupled anion symporter [Verrucomicrobia bacterium]|jgi:solute carrier family 13 (sodium-dependent dicarboxylate transporter), member 2/3/5|nr:DASS family sodium-coupled anion symporter [Verrucomicrobiota bacterium]
MQTIAKTEPPDYGFRQKVGWLLGPGALLMTFLIDAPEGLNDSAWKTLGAALLMAVWWITESIPIPATALVPLFLFPLLGLGTIREVAAPYANPLVFLFLGGFIIALAMQKWNLHRRMAINLISALGTRPTRVIAGFLLAGALTSMWVSNTATAMMMLPIATSVVALVTTKDNSSHPNLGPALLLAVAYGATTGGMATLIGTPPNALLAGYMGRIYGIDIGFGQWMMIGVPVTIVALPVVFFILTRVSFKLSSKEIPGMSELLSSEREKLGPLSKGEKAVAIVFACTALCWICRPLMSARWPMISDTTIAIGGALILFCIPIHARKGVFVMDWEATKGLPWGVLLLFGGGLSLASMINEHGLAVYLGNLTAGLNRMPLVLMIAILCFGILILTELTSNTGTAATFLPIAAAVALSLGQNPMLFLVPTALAANCSYMMPVGTPPNAIVFGSGLLKLSQMARAGLLINILLVPIVVAALWFLGPLVFDLELDVIPDWALELKEVL